MEKENIQISKEKVLAEYKQADNEKKTLLENLFGKELFIPKDITERIKTFDDAYQALGENHPYCRAFDNYGYAVKDTDVKDDSDIWAYLKLRIICAALNEGWEPQFTEDEYRYYPYFYLYTQEEIDRMDEDDKEQLLYVGGLANNGAQCGIWYARSHGAFSYSNPSIGARLAFKTRELAKYAGTQFAEIWSAFVFKPVEKKEKK